MKVAQIYTGLSLGAFNDCGNPSARGRGQGEGSRGETPYLKAGAQNL